MAFHKKRVAQVTLFAFYALGIPRLESTSCGALLDCCIFLIPASAAPLAATAGPSSYFFTVRRLLPMLDYVKMILLKVSFNKALFEKELRKALKMLGPMEVPDFRAWCYQQFARIYRRVLKRVFASFEDAPLQPTIG